MQRLTKTEEEVMQMIWELERCTVSDIRKQYTENVPPHSTVSSVVRILEKKGYVGHKAYGRTYEYYPLIAKEDYSHRRVQKIVGDYFEGSAANLVSFLLKEQEVDKDELKDLLKTLDDE
jgi:predicted transcriptional regulator